MINKNQYFKSNRYYTLILFLSALLGFTSFEIYQNWETYSNYVLILPGILGSGILLTVILGTRAFNNYNNNNK